MKPSLQAFAIHIPDAAGESTERTVTIDVPVRWDEVIGEWVLTEEAHEMIEHRKALEMGLLSPMQFKELRDRYGLNQKEMGALFQVGEKSWCRWESGKHRPTRSINLLVRALYDGELSLDYLRRRAGLGGPTGAESQRAAYYRGQSCRISTLAGGLERRSPNSRRLSPPGRRAVGSSGGRRTTASTTLVTFSAESVLLLV